MGITNRNTRSAIGARLIAIKRIGPLKLALSALALLMVSGVLAQSGGGYTLDPWVVADGGAIPSSGGGYSLGSTAGQTGAGVAGGGGYTLYSGFWKPGTVLQGPPLPILLPAIMRSVPPPTPVIPSCNDQENNDLPQDAKPLTTIGTTCSGSLQDDPEGEDDWYSINLAAAQTITIDLTGFPTDADYRLGLVNSNNTNVALPNASGADKHHFVYRATTAGRYLIRVYMAHKSTSTNSYYLKAVIS
jgi:hypothetical protein